MDVFGTSSFAMMELLARRLRLRSQLRPQPEPQVALCFDGVASRQG
jgi:hypothetical protein